MYDFFSQKLSSPSAKTVLFFPSLHHVEYPCFFIEPQSPIQVGLSETPLNARVGGLRDHRPGGSSGHRSLVGRGGLCYPGKQPRRFVEVIQPSLFRFVCHFVVTVFTFVQESPGRLLQHRDQNSVMCSQLPRTRDLLSPNSEQLHQPGACRRHVTATRCLDISGLWGLFVLSGQRSLAPGPSRTQVPPHIHATVPAGSLAQPCILLTGPGLWVLFRGSLLSSLDPSLLFAPFSHPRKGGVQFPLHKTPHHKAVAGK